MENQIKKILRTQRIYYVGYLLVLCVMVILYETELFPQGMWIDQAWAAYWAQTVGILLMITLLPAALKLWRFQRKKIDKDVTFQQLQTQYVRWCKIRLFLLALPLYVNVGVYYAILDSACLICASISLIAYLFCLPSRDKILYEIEIPVEE